MVLMFPVVFLCFPMALFCFLSGQRPWQTFGGPGAHNREAQNPLQEVQGCAATRDAGRRVFCSTLLLRKRVFLCWHRWHSFAAGRLSVSWYTMFDLVDRLAFAASSADA